MKQYLNESNWTSNSDDPNYLFNCERTPLIYKLYDMDGDLMYIGETCDGARRVSYHNRQKGWMSSNLEFIEVPLEQKSDIEKYLIQHYKPYHNSKFNSLYQGGHKYLYDIESGIVCT